MTEPQIIEGTRQELAAYLEHLPENVRYRVTLDIVEDIDQAANPSAKGLEVMRLLAERHKDRRITDAGSTKRLLREARSGAADSFDPTK